MQTESNFDSIEAAIEDIKNGKMIIVVDDEDRENEGDFVMAAEKISPEAVNFMSIHGRGLICAPLTEERSRELNLNLMVESNTAVLETNFTVSVDHNPSNTTGISATDRSNTIKALVNPATKPTELGRPGHIFPLIAKDGGVLRRAGHTEAAVDLARLAGLHPSGVICEIMNDDGSMARTPELFELAKKHDLKFITIQDLIHYKRNKELFVQEESVVNMPTAHGDFKLHLFENKHNPSEHHLALVKGEIKEGEPTLIRVHSECLTGDVFGSARCDCGDQLDAAMQKINEEGSGVIIYLRQEGRGIGLSAKIKAYALQEKGLDTVEANEKLGFKPDLRDYGFGAQMIHLLGIKKLRLMTNNPKKIVGLKGYDLEVVERVPLEVEIKKHNEYYMKTKEEKMGHVFMKRHHK
jgi:3,4-dihydroxy 2-butanone 4-phosphate synthase/GTP cyclohydrolase II